MQDTATSDRSDASAMQLHVCTTCRLLNEPAEPEHGRAGARLFAALQSAGTKPAGVEIVPVECMSVCRRACTIGFAAPGKWTYVFGDFHPDMSAEKILAAAALFADAPDGIIPWKIRPDAFKRGVVARIPPLTPRVDRGAS